MSNLICENCCNRVKGYGFICYDVVEQVCKDSITDNFTVYQGEEGMDTLIEFLEKKGLIISTDIHDDLIVLRPSRPHSKQNRFCWCKNDSSLPL